MVVLRLTASFKGTGQLKITNIYDKIETRTKDMNKHGNGDRLFEQSGQFACNIGE